MPKASESWEGGESQGTKETGTWQTCGRARFCGCLWGLCYERRAWEGAGVRGHSSGAAQGHCKLYLFVPAHMQPLPSFAVTPTAPSSQLLGFAQILCLIPQALAGKGAVVTWSGCREGGRRPSQVAGAWSFQLGWQHGEMAPVVNLWLPHAHVHTRVLTHTRTHIQCITDEGFKER